MVFRSRNVYNKLVLQQKYANTSSTRFYDYMWQIRDQIVKSWIGYLALFIGLLNYFTSINYLREYIVYGNLLQENNFDEIACEVAGSWIILSYSFLFEIVTGTIFFSICIMAIFMKACPAIGFLCPTFTSFCRKRMRGLPVHQYRQYEGEFDFDCDESSL